MSNRFSSLKIFRVDSSIDQWGKTDRLEKMNEKRSRSHSNIRCQNNHRAMRIVYDLQQNGRKSTKENWRCKRDSIVFEKEKDEDLSLIRLPKKTFLIFDKERPEERLSSVKQNEEKISSVLFLHLHIIVKWRCRLMIIKLKFIERRLSSCRSMMSLMMMMDERTNERATER